MAMSPRLLRPRASATGFDPRRIGTMLAWYDFSDSSTLTLVSALVSEIRNKSGTAPTLSQSVEANRPSLSTINGKQAALFDGSNDHLFSNTAVVGQGTLFGAFGRIGNITANVASFGQVSPSTVQVTIGVTTGSGPDADGFGGARSGATFSGRRGASTAPVIVVSATHDGSGTPAVRLNQSAALTTTSAFVGNNAHASIGARNVNAAYTGFFNDKIGEILYYSAVLSASQILSVERYLAAKWGVT